MEAIKPHVKNNEHFPCVYCAHVQKDNFSPFDSIHSVDLACGKLLFFFIMNQLTVFHKIISREVPAEILFEDADVIIFKDIRPKAATHLLLVPKRFLASVADVTAETKDIPGMLIEKARVFAKERGITGYKLTYHVGPDGGQEVMYIHLHFMSNQKLG